MNGQMIFSDCGPYSIQDIPQFDIDYRGLVKYAHSVSKKVPELSDAERNQFIRGATMLEVRASMLGTSNS